MTASAFPADGVVVDRAIVQPEWLDHNGHMNVTWFMKTFELGIDSYKALIGLDADYLERHQRSTVALESHITYQREAYLGDELRLETRLVDFDGKRVVVYQELYRDSDLLATQETLAISFDTAARRSRPFDPPIARNYQRLVDAQRHLPRPRWLGRAIGLGQGRPGA